jgi:branched-chain amino acid aminotransferase
MDGRLVEWRSAHLHVDTHCVLGGLNVYEVVGAFWSEFRQNLFLFRVEEHLRRLHLSAKVMRLHLQFSDAELVDAARALVAANEFREDVGIRIVAYFGAGPVFSYRPEEISTGVFITAKPVGQARRQGLHVCTAGWSRMPDIAAPPRVKAGANYQNVRLAQIQAHVDGYDDAVMLNSAAKVCEMPLANIFLVRSGVLVTPDVSTGILEGITRQTVLELAPRLGVHAVERQIERSELYAAEEAFATTTLTEISPILSIDRVCRGPPHPGSPHGSLAAPTERRNPRRRQPRLGDAGVRPPPFALSIFCSNGAS